MKYYVRQRSVYYEDFEVEAESSYEAVALVNSGAVNPSGQSEYLEVINTYILEEDGVYQAQEQPENATPIDRRIL